MEQHAPVIFLDLQTDDMTFDPDGIPIMAGVNSILPKEHGAQFFALPIVRTAAASGGADVEAIALWDSSLHDSTALNRTTQTHERVHVILKAHVRLTHPTCMEVILRKRLTLNVYKQKSLAERLKKRLSSGSGAGQVPASGVTYELVSCIPKASEDVEDRETLALVAASELSDRSRYVEETSDGDSFVDKYTRSVSAVESILALDRLRQEVAVKELLAAQAKHSPAGQRTPQSQMMRKTASVPNFALLSAHQMSVSSSRLNSDLRSDSLLDLSSFLASSAYEGFERMRSRASNLLSPGVQPPTGPNGQRDVSPSRLTTLPEVSTIKSSGVPVLPSSTPTSQLVAESAPSSGKNFVRWLLFSRLLLCVCDRTCSTWRDVHGAWPSVRTAL